MRASYKVRTDVVVKLVKAGANINLQNKVCLVKSTPYLCVYPTNAIKPYGFSLP